ncbi:MAG: FecR domain-containing protein [Prevotella sp.]|nr:FecR domain-containing protein [Prevotella sp.]
MNYEEIALLIGRLLTDTISDEDIEKLNIWRRQNDFNETVFQHLTDKEWLTREHIRRKLTNSERPLTEMKHRIEGERKLNGHRRWYWAAAIALLICGGATLLYGPLFETHKQQPTTIAHETASEIRPGTTVAILTQDGKKRIKLTDEASFERLSIQRKQDQQKTDSKSLAFNNLSTPRGGEFKITLEDGTEVWLNAETTLRYPECFGTDERRVEVSGEAYFKVAKEQDRPFCVVCGGQEVLVHGTEFNVNGYNDESDIYTTLVNGSISLHSIKGNGSELILTPGLQAVFNRSSESARVGRVNTYVMTSWRNGMFVFENQSMEQIMHTLSRWYNFEYEFSSQSVAKTVLMGSIPRYSSFAEVVDIFHKLGGIHLKQVNNKVIITTQK